MLQVELAQINIKPGKDRRKQLFERTWIFGKKILKIIVNNIVDKFLFNNINIKAVINSNIVLGKDQRKQ